ncbi:basic salivary proline-rich protein 2-like [Camponotus floridanus]|uniref:basic salivary proline-rich protein 2-like n=1 Tax=Camponotus floridanus TaxID=104421 RepID=UPI000DC6791C|nr:basic salivary proline-rich protein 2-like [Camponotus floridanus]
MTGNTPDGGPQVPPGVEIHLWPAAKGAPAQVPAPYSPMRGLTPPWAFRGSASPTTRILQGAAPPGGPHGRLGRGSRSPTPPYPPWRPARPHTGLAGSGGKRRPGGCRFGRGNGRGQPPGIQTLAARPRLGIRPSGSGAGSGGDHTGKTPVGTPNRCILRRTDPASETSERSVRPRAGSPEKSGHPISPVSTPRHFNKSVYPQNLKISQVLRVPRGVMAATRQYP